MFLYFVNLKFPASSHLLCLNTSICVKPVQKPCWFSQCGSIAQFLVHFQESMKMMGLNNWLHWLAWFVKYLLFMLVTVLIMLLFFSIQTSRGPVIGNTSPTVLFVFLMLYAVSTISFCFAVSTFFSKGRSHGLTREKPRRFVPTVDALSKNIENIKIFLKKISIFNDEKFSVYCMDVFP